MRELTKSILRFSWAMPLFGVKQLASLAMPRDWHDPGRDAVNAMDSVALAAQEQLGEGFRQAFEWGDRLQRQAVDLMFGAAASGASAVGASRPAWTPPPARATAAGPPAPPPVAAPRPAAGAPPSAAEAAELGWGPVPPQGG